MAVRANDIALRDLLEQLGDADASGQLRNQACLRRWIAVIELHACERKCSAAVCAWLLLELIQQCSVTPTASVKLLAGATNLRRRLVGLALKAIPQSAKLSLPIRPDAVAVRADDVTLRDLREQALA
jgi:hypothetical protein